MALKVGDKVVVRSGKSTSDAHTGVATIKDIAERNPVEYALEFEGQESLGWYTDESLEAAPAETTDTAPDNAFLAEMSVADLKDLAGKEGADLTGLHLKDEIVQSIRKHRRSVARKTQ